MNRYLIVVDMQNDFVSGALGSEDAKAVCGKVCDKITSFDGKIIATLDTHGENYPDTQEGRNLPVTHCVKGTLGHELEESVKAGLDKKDALYIEKPTFGSADLFEYLKKENEKNAIDSIELIGVCTDICVLSNAIGIKAFLPEVPVFVDASCCAGTSEENHNNALSAMKCCQILITNE